MTNARRTFPVPWPKQTENWNTLSFLVMWTVGSRGYQCIYFIFHHQSFTPQWQVLSDGACGKRRHVWHNSFRMLTASPPEHMLNVIVETAAWQFYILCRQTFSIDVITSLPFPFRRACPVWPHLQWSHTEKVSVFLLFISFLQQFSFYWEIMNDIRGMGNRGEIEGRTSRNAARPGHWGVP